MAANPQCAGRGLAVTGFAFSIGWSRFGRACSGPRWTLARVRDLDLFHVAGGMGAGDVKLFAAAATWLGPGGAWRASSSRRWLEGYCRWRVHVAARTREGVERVAMSLSMFSLAPLGKVAPDEQRKAYLPYGVALACGALLIGWIPGILTN